MQTVEQVAESTAIDLARECLYRFLAAVLSDPYGEAWRAALDPRSQQLARQAADLLRTEAGERIGDLARGELPPEHLDLEPVLVELSRPVEHLRAEFDRVFGLVVPRECPPYETEYHSSSETFFRSQQLADIAGFYRAFGLDAAHDRPDRPDHVALELEFMAFLLMKRRLAVAQADKAADAPNHARVCEDAEHSFFRDHLAWWMPAFATGLRRKAGGGYYSALGQVLAALIPVERHHLHVAAALKPAQPDLIEPPEEQAGCSGALTCHRCSLP